MPHEYEQREGLSCVTRNPANTLVNVVFVHGLGGGAFSTWNSGDSTEVGFWPAAVAKKHPRCCIWTVHYTARLLEWNPFARARTIDLLDRAAWLVHSLVQKQIPSKPIVFVTHSLGGVVVKQALQFAQSLGPPEWRAVWERTQAVFFLATPHVGSNLADVAGIIADVVRNSHYLARLFLRRSPAVTNLEKNNPTLRYLSDWYRDHAPAQGVETVAFAERRLYKGVLVVDESSANPGVAGRPATPLSEDDHISIAKPSHVGHLVYERLSGLLAELERRQPVAVSPAVDWATLALRAESRALSMRLCGEWWERHLNMDPAKVSYFTIRPDTLLNSIRLNGKGYNEQGKVVSKWNSVLVRVDRDRENNEIVVRYVWNGKYRASEEAAKREVSFHGFAEFRFYESEDPAEWISRGEGHYWNVDEAALEKTQFRRIELRRVTKQGVMRTMEKEDEADKARCIREALDGWGRSDDRLDESGSDPHRSTCVADEGSQVPALP